MAIMANTKKMSAAELQPFRELAALDAESAEVLQTIRGLL